MLSTIIYITILFTISLISTITSSTYTWYTEFFWLFLREWWGPFPKARREIRLLPNMRPIRRHPTPSEATKVLSLRPTPLPPYSLLLTYPSPYPSTLLSPYPPTPLPPYPPTYLPTYPSTNLPLYPLTHLPLCRHEPCYYTHPNFCTC